MSLDDLRRWEPRWRAAAGPPAAPEPFLLESVGDLAPGPVLDAAAGDGRNALWLAERGREVTAVDVAPAATARLAREAARLGLSLTLRTADLDEPGGLAGLGPFASLVVVRFRPSPLQWRHLGAVTRPSARLLLCSFGIEQHRRHGFPLAYCLDRAALERELAPGWRLLRWHSFSADDDALEGSLWERPG